MKKVSNMSEERKSNGIVDPIIVPVMAVIYIWLCFHFMNITGGDLLGSVLGIILSIAIPLSFVYVFGRK